MIEMVKAQLEGGILFIPSILLLLILFGYLIFRVARNLFPRHAMTDAEVFTRLLSEAGYSYDSVQEIFYSKQNAWQRKYGYCRLYDEAAPTLGMIIDSEPVYFEYGGKRWLIEFWKGQYHLNTGCEIGVYYTDQPDLVIPGLFRGAFYECVGNEDRLDLTFTLYQNGRRLLQWSSRHWWLAAFKPGEFSEPWELTMRIRITLKDHEMCRSFVRALKRIGYEDRELYINQTTVSFTFSRAHTPQPLSRSEETDWIIQRNNERVCRLYQEITSEVQSWPDKLKVIREKQPVFYKSLVNIGKTKQIFKAFDRLKAFL